MTDTGHERTSILTGEGKRPAGGPPYMRAATSLGDSKVASCGDHRRIAPKQAGRYALTRYQPRGRCSRHDVLILLLAHGAARLGPPFRWQLLTGLIALFSLAACGTSGIIDTKPQTHVAISEPQNYNLPFASYLIGIEKASKKAVGEFNRLQCHAGEDYCFDIRQLDGQAFKEARDDLDDPRVEFVSHILRYEGPPLTRPAPVVPIYTIYPAAPASLGTAAIGSYVEASWDALVGDLARDLRRRVSEERVTHILVFSTGWNTLQAASFANYRDWWSEILAEHDRICGTPTAPACGDSGLFGFRPLFVGITWDSDWPRAAVLGVEDYWNKASDADEIGLTWANLLFNRVLKKVRAEYGARIVAVGHSFGTRLLSRAVHSAPLIVAAPSEPIDLFIGLQGAFPYKRFLPGEGAEGAPYADYATAARKFLFTTSVHDTAVETARLWTTFIGDELAFTETQQDAACKSEAEPHSSDRAATNSRGLAQPQQSTAPFEHSRLNAEGDWDEAGAPGLSSTCIAMLEASAFIDDHNDVYHRAAARLILNAIGRFAPSTSRSGKPMAGTQEHSTGP